LVADTFNQKEKYSSAIAKRSPLAFG